MQASELVCELENREASRMGVSIALARTRLAGRIGVAPGTLENMRRGRIKHLSYAIVEKIRSAFIAELQSEMQRLQHEIEMATRCGEHPGSDEIIAAQTHIEAAKKLIGR